MRLNFLAFDITAKDKIVCRFYSHDSQLKYVTVLSCDTVMLQRGHRHCSSDKAIMMSSCSGIVATAVHSSTMLLAYVFITCHVSKSSPLVPRSSLHFCEPCVS